MAILPPTSTSTSFDSAESAQIQQNNRSLQSLSNGGYRASSSSSSVSGDDCINPLDSSLSSNGTAFSSSASSASSAIDFLSLCHHLKELKCF
ncbi:hypothetical protein QYF36_022986 [Acer negundo]|nr:hypothetical protein QYF36_022986 [Acer negundo]